MRRVLSLLLVFTATGVTATGGADLPKTETVGRVVEGSVVAAGGKPVIGAKILFGPSVSALNPTEGATATTNTLGHFRIDLGKFDWSKEIVQSLVLAPGYRPAQRKLEPEKNVADFVVVAEPWKETLVRLEDEKNKPVPGVEVVVSLSGIVWARPKTDAQGSCRIEMGPGVFVGLSAAPRDARPILASLGIRKDGPASVTLPVFPLIRGRVLDGEGRPQADVAIGTWVTFYRDGDGEMILMPYFHGEPATTDRNGSFLFPLKVMLTHGELELPKLPHRPLLLAFADRALKNKAYTLIDQYRPTEPLEVKLEQARKVRLPIEWSLVPPIVEGELESMLKVAKRPGSDDDFFIHRDLSKAIRDNKTILEEDLPPGSYQVEITLTESGRRREWKASREFVVTQGDGPLNVRLLTLEPAGFSKLVGKPAPEIEATDLNTGRPVTLIDFRGKVVLLDFWGYWCGPCVGAMPHLMKLRDKFAGRPLEVIALHDGSVQSRAEYDRKIAVVRRQLWGDRDLPFRVLLDRPDPKRAADVYRPNTWVTDVRTHG